MPEWRDPSNLDRDGLLAEIRRWHMAARMMNDAWFGIDEKRRRHAKVYRVRWTEAGHDRTHERLFGPDDFDEAKHTAMIARLDHIDVTVEAMAVGSPWQVVEW